MANNIEIGLRQAQVSMYNKENLPTNSTIINNRHMQLAIRSLLVAPFLAFFIFDRLRSYRTKVTLVEVTRLNGYLLSTSVIVNK